MIAEVGYSRVICIIIPTMKYFQNQNIGATLEDELDDTDTDDCENHFEDSSLDPVILTESQVSYPASSQSQVSNLACSQSQSSNLRSSQSEASNLASSQSTYVPSSLGRDSEVLEDYVDDGTVVEIQHLTVLYKLNNSEPDEFCGTTVIVMWASLLQLLCKCRRVGCGASVLPDNIRATRKGKSV